MDTQEIISGLTDMERQWFIQKEWGSWVYMVGQDLAQKGLTRCEGGSIYLTELGEKVQSILRAKDQTP